MKNSKETDVDRIKRRDIVTGLPLETAGREVRRAYDARSRAQTSAFLPDAVTTRRQRKFGGRRNEIRSTAPKTFGVGAARSQAFDRGPPHTHTHPPTTTAAPLLAGQIRRRGNANFPAYEEICILARMAARKSEFGAISSPLRDLRDVRDAISMDPTRGGTQDQPICPRL